MLPTFDELPSVPGYEDSDNLDLKGCAWSLWGDGDELGTVNLLTPAVVKQSAAECIQTGHAVRLDLPVNFPAVPAFGRKPFEHDILPMISKAARDDTLSFNPQSSSQWDGLRHYGVTDLDLFYGGVPNSQIPLGKRTVTEEVQDPLDYRLSIHHWARHGITGRGVFIDVARYAASIGIDNYGPYEGIALTVQNIEDIAKIEQVSFRTADILLIRTGGTKVYMAKSVEERKSLRSLKTTKFTGVEQSEEMKRFLWNNHFSALVGDAMSFEVMPTISGRKMLHQTILGLWGCPIGELFDLEELSEHCAKEGRYTFFFNALPLNIIGGVSSPPCAQAIF